MLSFLIYRNSGESEISGLINSKDPSLFPQMGNFLIFMKPSSLNEFDIARAFERWRKASGPPKRPGQGMARFPRAGARAHGG